MRSYNITVIRCIVSYPRAHLTKEAQQHPQATVANEAENEALISGLQLAWEIGAEYVVFHNNSKLVTRGINEEIFGEGAHIKGQL